MSPSLAWAGNILEVDLTTGDIKSKPLAPGLARRYLGGSGFNSIKLFESVGPEVDPLGAENVLLFGTGPLCGTLAPGGARLTITAKSPQTDAFGDANMGGFFGTELKFAGYDQIIFKGKSKTPVYLLVGEDHVALKDASHLWGKSTWETARGIKEDLDDFLAEVACIGQAGENLVRIANIIAPPRHAAGRTGMGAVMGSKFLKAVAVQGSKSISIARPKEFAQACIQMRENIVKVCPAYPGDKHLGSPGFMEMYCLKGIGGVRNYRTTLLPGWEGVSGKTFLKEFSTGRKACSACFVACGHSHSVSAGEFTGTFGEGPEMGLTAMAISCGITYMPGLLKINELLNQYGMDPLSLQSILAWAMECYEKGILTAKDFGGTPLSFGDYRACIEMIPRIVKREGFGTVLAEGEKRAPLAVGKDSQKYMHHVKGMALVNRDPRADKQLGLQYITSTRGADHLKGIQRAASMLRETAVGMKLFRDADTMDSRNPKGKGLLVKTCEDMIAVLNAIGICVRSCGSVFLLTEMLSLATGVDFNTDELLASGERIYNVQKAFNSVNGLTRDDDNFSNPARFLNEPLTDGPYAGGLFERDSLLDDYYEARGWDKASGLQTRQKLAELGLDDVAVRLEEVGALDLKSDKTLPNTR